MYMGQNRHEGTDGVQAYSITGTMGRVVMQGCPLSPLLLNILIERLVREAVERIIMEEGIKVGGRWIKVLMSADDQAMMARSQKGPQAMMDRLKTQFQPTKRMKINIKE